MMKSLTTFLFLLFSTVSGYSQDLIEKWNNYQKQYEYFNASNEMVGYKKYNYYSKSWEYYEVKNTQQVQRQDENFELWKDVLQTRQNRYDYNKQRIQKAIDDMRTMLDTKFDFQASKILKDYMNENYISKVSNMSVDLSYDENADNIINWINKGLNDFLQKTWTSYTEQSEIEKSNAHKALMEVNYNSGEYVTNKVVEEKFNPYTEDYEPVNTDVTLSKVVISTNAISYYRQYSGVWRTITVEYLSSDDKVHIFLDVNKFTRVVVDKSFNYVIFYENKIGDRYTKRYIYDNIQKTINH